VNPSVRNQAFVAVVLGVVRTMSGGSGPEEVLDIDRLHAAAKHMVADVHVMLVREQTRAVLGHG
jgi:hypothetical protein